MDVLEFWMLRVFLKFCKFNLLVKLSFIFFPRGRRHYAEPCRLLCFFFFFAIVYHYIHISPKVAVTKILVIAQLAFPQQNEIPDVARILIHHLDKK